MSVRSLLVIDFFSYLRAYLDYRKEWQMDAAKGWGGIKVTYPPKEPAGGGRGGYAGQRGGTKQKQAVYANVTDMNTLYWMLQDTEYLKDIATQLVDRTEAKWLAANKGQPPGTRVAAEERHVVAFQDCDERGNKDFPIMLLMVCSTWHMTAASQHSLEEPRFIRQRCRIQWKFASKNFGTASNMRDGAAYMNYGDLMALADSRELGQFLDRLYRDHKVKLNKRYLPELCAAMNSLSFKDAVEDIVNPVAKEIGGDDISEGFCDGDSAELQQFRVKVNKVGKEKRQRLTGISKLDGAKRPARKG